MTLTRLHIDGYLQFCDFNLEFGPNINVIHGPNEAGKSTLFRFIRYVLFGPPRRVAHRGSPLAGGRFGGSLWFDPGPVCIERFNKSFVVSEGGIPRPEGDLRDLLGQFDQAAFDAVFACDLEGLGDMGALTEDSLRRRLFASSVLGVGVDIDQVEKQWKSRRIALATRGRKNGIIYHLELSVKRVKEELEDLRQSARALPDRLEQLRSLNSEIEQTSTYLASQRNDRGLAQAILDIADTLSDRDTVNTWLSTRIEPEHSPTIWTHRLAMLKEAARAKNQALEAESVLQVRLQSLTQEYDNITLDKALLEVEAELKSVSEQGSELPELNSRKSDIQEATVERNNRFDSVGLDSLDAVDLSPSTEQEIILLASKVPQYTDLEATKQDLEQKETVLVAAKSALSSCSPPDPALVALEHRIESITESEQRRREAASELLHVQSELDNTLQRREELTQKWPQTPRLDASELTRWLVEVDVWREECRSRDALETESARTCDQLQREIQRLRAPVEIRKISSHSIQWADRRRSVTALEDQIKQHDTQSRQLTSLLEQELLSVPYLQDINDLRSCTSAPWETIKMLVERLLRYREKEREEPGTEQNTSVSSPEPLHEQQRVGMALHSRRDGAHRWRFATRALFILLALLSVMSFVAWVIGFGNGFVVISLILLTLLFIFADLFVTSIILRTSRELTRIEAGDRESWMAGIQRELARIDVQNQQIRSLGAVDAHRTERDQAKGELEHLLQDVPLLATAGLRDLAEVATRVPRCLDTLQQLDRSQAETTSLQQVVKSWTVEGVQHAQVLKLPAPQTVRSAYDVAEAIVNASELAKRQTLQDNTRKDSLQTKTQELAELQQIRQQRKAPTKREAAIDAAMIQAGGESISPQSWLTWLESGRAVEEIDATILALKTRMATIKRRSSNDSQIVADALRVAGIEEVEKIRERVEQACTVRNTFENRKSEVENATKEHSRAKIIHTQAKKAAAARDQALMSLNDQLAKAGWPIDLPDRIPALAERLRAAHQAERTRQKLLRTHERETERWQEWFKKVQRLQALLNAPPRPIEQSKKWIRTLRDRLSREKMHVAERRTLIKQIDQIKRDLEEAHEKVRITSDKLLNAQQISGDEEAAIRQFEEAEEWKKNQDRAREIDQILRAKLGDTDLQSIEYRDRGILEDRIEQLNAAIIEQNHIKDDLIEERGNLKQRIEDIKCSARIIELADEVNALQEKLRRARLELAEIELAARWLREEYERYIRENQPAVLRRASDLLQRASNRTMAAVLEKNKKLYIQSPDGKPREPHELSRGSREMLYLVIRLALALEHAKRTQAPILLDDVMVNQDPERAEQIAQVLRIVGEDHQVILMTCRPEMRDLMCAVDPTARVIELERFAGKDGPVGTTHKSKRPHQSADRVIGRVVEYLSTVDGWKGRRDIIEGAELSESDWSQFRILAGSDPRIEHNGKSKRGSAYRVSVIAPQRISAL